MEKAISARVDHGVSWARCASRFEVPETTLRRAVASLLNNRPIGVRGRPRYFAPEEEAEIEQFLLKETDKHQSLRPCDILDLVCVFFLII